MSKTITKTKLLKKITPLITNDLPFPHEKFSANCAGFVAEDGSSAYDYCFRLYTEMKASKTASSVPVNSGRTNPFTPISRSKLANIRSSVASPDIKEKISMFEKQEPASTGPSATLDFFADLTQSLSYQEQSEPESFWEEQDDDEDNDGDESYVELDDEPSNYNATQMDELMSMVQELRNQVETVTSENASLKNRISDMTKKTLDMNKIKIHVCGEKDKSNLGGIPIEGFYSHENNTFYVLTNRIAMSVKAQFNVVNLNNAFVVSKPKPQTKQSGKPKSNNNNNGNSNNRGKPRWYPKK